MDLMNSTAAYLRISSDKQDVSRQRESIERWAKRSGAAIDLWFQDSEGRNPRDMAHKRQGFQKMLRAVEAGLVSCIVVDSQDRFGTRDAHQWGAFLTLLRDNGCTLYDSSGKNLSADNDSTVLLGTLGALTSTREQKEKAHRNVTGKIRLAKLGEFQGGNPPFGFDVVCIGADGKERWRTVYVGHYKRWKVYPDGTKERYDGKDNAPRKDATDTLYVRPSIEKDRLTVVRQMFAWYATEAVSPRQIATRLNELKVDPVFGAWDKVKIRQMLANPVYIGLPTWNKKAASRFVEYVDGQIREVSRVNGKVMAGRDRDPSDYVQPDKPQFKPIIDSKTWAKVQEKLAKATGDSPPKRPPAVEELWLKPFIQCGRCGRTMTAARGNGTPRLKPSYFCATYNKFGIDNPTGCHCHRVCHEHLETIVKGYLDATAPKVAALMEATATGNLELAKPLLEQLSFARNDRGSVWLDMLAFIEDKGTSKELAKLRRAGADFDTLYGLIFERVRPKLEADIAAREAELDRKLVEFGTLSPKLKARANKAMESMQDEIEAMQRDLIDLRQPWHNLKENVVQRQAHLERAQAVLCNGAAGRQKTEALGTVVDRIVCHFKHTATKAQQHNGKSILERVEINAISGEKACFSNGNMPAPG
jgi:DNA invertase Pin-like site-specific DNA recombinase